MEDQEGITYSPSRLDPLANVQFADFSRVQYLKLGEQEEEEQETDDKGT